VPSIEILTLPVGELRKNPWNTNKASPEAEAKIRKSIERNGMFKPILVRRVEGQGGYEIIGGEHRWEQAVALGYTEIACANLGLIDTRRAKEIGVLDNARYGADDTLSFAELLKEIGDIGDLQEFLPYGSADLDAIFSASVIALDDLELDENFEKIADEPEAPAPKAPKTHTVMRFKVGLGDAERLTALIASTQKTHGYTAADELTNAGDALVHLLGLTTAPAAVETSAIEDVDALLDAALKDFTHE
jgi:hypothetical protein